MNPSTQVLAVAIVGGVAAQWIGRLAGLPAIIPLLILGVILGPEGPEWLRCMPSPEEALGPGMAAIVSLGVAIILFEGGLSLNLSDYRLAPKAVRNLLTVGALVSFAGGTLCAALLAHFDWPIALLFGSLMIVTGPTVIVPLLRNVRVVPRVHTVLLWEGILIDAIGAIAAVVTMEVVLEGSGFFKATAGFLSALLFGPALGLAGGWLLACFLMWRSKTGRAEGELDRLLALAGAIGIYTLSDRVVNESGLGAVTCAGMMVANRLRGEAEELREFKGTLTTLLVSVLFMILAANFRLDDLVMLWPNGFLAIGAMMLVVRPISVFLCTMGSKLSAKERIFLGWIAPRGIVAASVAALFGILLKSRGQDAAGRAIVALTFSTIMVTVVLNGLTAYPLAWLLGILAKSPRGLLIAGANELARSLALVAEARGFAALLVDTNPDLCQAARQAGLRVIEGSVLDSEFLASHDISGLGCLLAMTTSSSVNARASSHTAAALRLDKAFAVVTPTASGDDLRLLESGMALRAFAEQVDLGAILNLMRRKLAKLKEFPWPLRDEGPQGQPFLPLLVLNQEGLMPFSAGRAVPAGSRVIGLSFTEQDPAALPFAAAGSPEGGVCPAGA